MLRHHISIGTNTMLSFQCWVTFLTMLKLYQQH